MQDSSLDVSGQDSHSIKKAAFLRPVSHNHYHPNIPYPSSPEYLIRPLAGYNLTYNPALFVT
ncbi:hypothetical protein, partial [Salmonella enterica]|uniref:hypothetical protein n=1 Tax=Salmonella enterica TaxID=28901 RepID=UPI001C4E0041